MKNFILESNFLFILFSAKTLSFSEVFQAELCTPQEAVAPYPPEKALHVAPGPSASEMPPHHRCCKVSTGKVTVKCASGGLSAASHTLVAGTYCMLVLCQAAGAAQGLRV